MGLRSPIQSSGSGLATAHSASVPVLPGASGARVHSGPSHGTGNVARSSWTRVDAGLTRRFSAHSTSDSDEEEGFLAHVGIPPQHEAGGKPLGGLEPGPRTSSTALEWDEGDAPHHTRKPGGYASSTSASFHGALGGGADSATSRRGFTVTPSPAHLAPSTQPFGHAMASDAYSPLSASLPPPPSFAKHQASASAELPSDGGASRNRRRSQSATTPPNPATLSSQARRRGSATVRSSSSLAAPPQDTAAARPTPRLHDSSLSLRLMHALSHTSLSRDGTPTAWKAPPASPTGVRRPVHAKAVKRPARGKQGGGAKCAKPRAASSWQVVPIPRPRPVHDSQGTAELPDRPHCHRNRSASGGSAVTSILSQVNDDSNTAPDADLERALLGEDGAWRDISKSSDREEESASVLDTARLAQLTQAASIAARPGSVKPSSSRADLPSKRSLSGPTVRGSTRTRRTRKAQSRTGSRKKPPTGSVMTAASERRHASTGSPAVSRSGGSPHGTGPPTPRARRTDGACAPHSKMFKSSSRQEASSAGLSDRERTAEGAAQSDADAPGSSRRPPAMQHMYQGLPVFPMPAHALPSEWRADAALAPVHVPCAPAQLQGLQAVPEEPEAHGPLPHLAGPSWELSHAAGLPRRTPSDSHSHISAFSEMSNTARSALSQTSAFGSWANSTVGSFGEAFVGESASTGPKARGLDRDRRARTGSRRSSKGSRRRRASAQSRHSGASAGDHSRASRLTASGRSSRSSGVRRRPRKADLFPEGASRDASGRVEGDAGGMSKVKRQWQRMQEETRNSLAAQVAHRAAFNPAQEVSDLVFSKESGQLPGIGHLQHTHPSSGAHLPAAPRPIQHALLSAPSSPRQSPPQSTSEAGSLAHAAARPQRKVPRKAPKKKRSGVPSSSSSTAGRSQASKAASSASSRRKKKSGVKGGRKREAAQNADSSPSIHGKVGFYPRTAFMAPASAALHFTGHYAFTPSGAQVMLMKHASGGMCWVPLPYASVGMPFTRHAASERVDSLQGSGDVSAYQSGPELSVLTESQDGMADPASGSWSDDSTSALRKRGAVPPPPPAQDTPSGQLSGSGGPGGLLRAPPCPSPAAIATTAHHAAQHLPARRAAPTGEPAALPPSQLAIVTAASVLSTNSITSIPTSPHSTSAASLSAFSSTGRRHSRS